MINIECYSKSCSMRSLIHSNTIIKKIVSVRCLLLIACAVIASSQAYATDVQMLPPTVPPNSPVASCSSTEILSYIPGNTIGSAINCVPVTSDQYGNLTTSGSVVSHGNVTSTGNMASTGNITSSGNVTSVGSVTATGLINSGSTAITNYVSTQTCGTGATTDAPEGTIRFNTSTKTIEGCNGTSWSSLLNNSLQVTVYNATPGENLGSHLLCNLNGWQNGNKTHIGNSYLWVLPNATGQWIFEQENHGFDTNALGGYTYPVVCVN